MQGRSAWWSVPLAVLIGVPMYSNAAGIIPVVQAFLAKGAALGAVLAFMMSVIALSLPELIILSNVLKPRLIATFVAVVTLGILVVGFLFNCVPLYPISRAGVPVRRGATMVRAMPKPHTLSALGAGPSGRQSGCRQA